MLFAQGHSVGKVSGRITDIKPQISEMTTEKIIMSRGMTKKQQSRSCPEAAGSVPCPSWNTECAAPRSQFCEEFPPTALRVPSDPAPSTTQVQVSRIQNVTEI